MKMALKFNFGRELFLGGVGLLFMCAPIAGQNPSRNALHFDVAAIKPCPSGAISPGGGGGQGGGAAASVSPGRLTVKCQTVKGLITTAYVLFANGKAQGAAGLRLLPIAGGPAWINSETFTINAETEEKAGDWMMRGPMLQALLEDRFKLKTHRETREVPVFEVTVGKGGFRLKPAEDESCTTVDFSNLQKIRPDDGEKPYCGQMVTRFHGPNLIMEAHSMTLDDFTKWLDGGLDRLVLNKTGIAGKFDFHLEFAPDDSTPGFHAFRFNAAGEDEIAVGASIFTVLQEQFGLKLVPARGPGEFLVIDSVERPSEN
jgi:uncharacterized protein (TIGR03435 family)